MSARTESLQQFAPIYADLAEITVADPSFRKADGKPFEGQYITVGEVEAHTEARNAAREVIFDALVSHSGVEAPEMKWEMSRIAAIKEIGGTALGSFSTYFALLGGETHPTFAEADELPEGDHKVIRTNSSIVTANRLYEEPIEFLDTSLGIIDRRMRQDRFAIGPENYATALKFFTNKYSELDNPSAEVNIQDIKELVTDVLKGFVTVSRRDEPNFVEMTNIYTSIRTLPKGSVDKVFTRSLIEQSLRSLPEYANETIATLYGALTKLDLSSDGEAAANLVNLALRKSKKFETTNDFRVALRAIEVLPRSETSEQAFDAFMQYRNGLESSLTLEGADEVTHRLRQIAENVVESPKLHVQIKELGETIARKTSELCKRAFLEGGLTREQEEQIKQTFARIMTNYKSI